jgi:hypothetical protein
MGFGEGEMREWRFIGQFCRRGLELAADGVDWFQIATDTNTRIMALEIASALGSSNVVKGHNLVIVT